ncbi:pentapeptide repeat-containing protein [Actinacidiphila yeochonensis]|uniref:pentapeptide repeat-containing protein n=1 Tax=Actinacidiphila yeochonensis TaxID=89050 RepID=UPI001E58D37A|nr:pentapeptide repeat-containing protein [Actinacidiphila yeochonensis]
MSLSPGADLDLRGTSVDETLIGRVLTAMTDPATRRPTIGNARFDSAVFPGDASFGSATFTGHAWFGSATFTEDAWFGSATFTGHASFGSATFTGHASFGSATFTEDAWFGSATFTQDAWFDSATFTGHARFDSATFTEDASFGSATFSRDARFDSATFTQDAWFDSATFTGHARFDSATFTGHASFDSATFTGHARFDSATFTGHASFGSATFTQDASFESATFTQDASFGSATFTGHARFDSATFTRETRFGSATFTRDAGFTSTVFKGTSVLGPLVCAGTVNLSSALFGVAVTVEVAAKAVLFRRTRWAQPATVWLRYADADVSDAVAEYPVTIAARPRPFTHVSGDLVDESVLAGLATVEARVTSLRGVDAAQMILTDLDLSQCLFAGTVHLNQLRLEGDCRFAATPEGVHRRGRLWLVRCTRRRTLAEEHHWRHGLPRAVIGWQPPLIPENVVQPRALAAVYRALRTSHEDSGNEPGAADFYYGEMEMRRADPRTAPGERGLLTAYWALSGYGLRATRALGWLLLAVAGTMLVMMLWGLPQRDTSSLSTGIITGHRITVTTDSPAPENPTGPPGDRFTTERFEKSLRIVVNSVVFRSSGQDLTTTGTYTEMASRLTEPVLLGFAVLAVRGRIKR